MDGFVNYSTMKTQPDDLRKLKIFDSAYRGAEYYSLQDRNNTDFIEKIQMSDRWFELMFKNQKTKDKLTPKEFEEFKSLCIQLKNEQ